MVGKWQQKVEDEKKAQAPTLHEQYCARRLHGSKRGVRRRRRTARVATPRVAAPMTIIASPTARLRSPIMTRSRRKGIMLKKINKAFFKKSCVLCFIIYLKNTCNGFETGLLRPQRSVLTTRPPKLHVPTSGKKPPANQRFPSPLHKSSPRSSTCQSNDVKGVLT